MSGGPRLPQRPPRPQLPVGKSVVIAVVLSVLIPGVGHLYIGRYLRGLVWFVGAVAIGVILNQQAVVTPTALALIVLVSVLASIDAWVLMKRDPASRP